MNIKKEFKENIFNNRFTIFLHCLIFISLILLYTLFLIPYGSDIMFGNEFDLKRLIVVLLVFILNIIIHYSVSNRKDFFTLVWSIISVQFLYGELIYYLFNPVKFTFMILTFIFCLTISLINGKTKLVNSSESSIDLKTIKIITIVLFLPFLYYLPYIDFSNLLLKNIYETREIFRMISLKPLNYLIAPLTRILLPIIIIEDAKERKFKSLIIFSSIFIYIYLCGAFKSVFLGLGFVVVFAFYNYKNKERLYLSATLIGVISSLILKFTTGNVLFINLIRRFIFVPPYMNNVYQKHFINNYTYGSHSGLSFGMLTNSIGNLPFYVGEQVLGIKGLSANTGLLADGYTSFGYLGSILMIIIMVGLLCGLYYSKIKSSYFGLTYMYIYYFNNAHLSTLLLTHALIFYIIFVIYLYFNSTTVIRRKKNEKS